MSKFGDLFMEALDEQGIELYEGEYDIDVEHDGYTFTLSYSLEKEDGDLYSEDYNDDDDADMGGNYELKLNSLFVSGNDADGERIKIDAEIEQAVKDNASYPSDSETDDEEDYL